jgi:hypothetical protein
LCCFSDEFSSTAITRNTLILEMQEKRGFFCDLFLTNTTVMVVFAKAPFSSPAGAVPLLDATGEFALDWHRSTVVVIEMVYVKTAYYRKTDHD